MVRVLSIFLLLVSALLAFPATAGCPGCCSSHGGVSNSCSAVGRIYCNDGTVSPTCTCGSCGVSAPPSTITSSCPFGQSIVDGLCYSPAAAGSCGVDRWSVKTGADVDSAGVNTGVALSTTVSSITSIAAPQTLPETSRVKPVENSVYVLDATLSTYRLTEDSDYHLVLTDSAGKTMIVEIPHPDCVAPGSPFKSAISTARSTFDRTLRASTSFKTTSVPVRVYGVGFFDDIHGQTGVAPNGIELHPVLQLVFNPTVSASTNQAFPLLSDADRVFNWAEATYPQYFPGPSVAGTYSVYSYRYFASTGNYMGTGNGRAVVHNGRDWNFLDLGAISDYIELAKRGGY